MSEVQADISVGRHVEICLKGYVLLKKTQTSYSFKYNQQDATLGYVKLA
jgi:hypothetical protein